MFRRRIKDDGSIKEYYVVPGGGIDEGEDEEVAVKEFRKYLAYYTKGLKDSSEFRNVVNKLNSKNEVLNLLDEYFYQ